MRPFSKIFIHPVQILVSLERLFECKCDILKYVTAVKTKSIISLLSLSNEI